MQAADEKNSFTEYDVSHGDFSWMQDVNPARSEEEQNLEAIRTSEDKIYYRSTRDISAGEELRVWLAPSLEQEHGIRLHPRDTEEELKG